MKSYNQIIILILVIFFKTETLLSESNLFNVNNIELKKKNKITNEALADKAIKKGFGELIDKILLKKDSERLSDLSFPLIKELVTYYQITNVSNEEQNDELVNFSVTFDKDKIHNLFYKRGISYSDILDKELYILPLLIKNNEIFIFSNNFFYKNWNSIDEKVDLIEFILPLENIETIKSVNEKKSNLISLNLNELFKEYLKKNIALILIEEKNNKIKNAYIKAKIQSKNLSKNLNFKKENLDNKEFNIRIISELKKELINLVKSSNLIDIRTPSFLNVKLDLNKKSNLVNLKSKLKKIESIENVFVQEFNKDTMSIKIKYLGKLEKVIEQLKNEKINLKLINDEWAIKTF